MNNYLKVKDLYEYLSQLIAENKGNCPVGLCVNSLDNERESLSWDHIDIDSITFEEDALCINTYLSDGLSIVEL